MKVIEKLILLIFIFLPTLSLQAQSVLVSAAKNAPRSVQKHARLIPSSAQISRSLSNRVQTSFERSVALQASRAHQHILSTYAYGTSGTPGKKLTGPLPKQFTAVLYPGMEHIISSGEQLSKYFVLRNNREALKSERYIQRQLKSLHEQLPVLKAHQKVITHEPENDLAWLQDQIPSDISYLLIGEIHTFPIIQEKIASFIPLIRQKFPEREIILVTEFLPMGTVFSPTDFTPNDPSPTYNQVWLAAHQAGISTIGVEPPFVDMLEEDLMIGVCARKDMWCSAEGIRQRNNYWKRIIQQVRKRHPDALFIVYAGASHLLYNEPFSVGTSLALQDKTFLLSLVPGFSFKNMPRLLKKTLEFEKWFQANKDVLDPNVAPYSRFDFATQMAFPQRILQFSPQYNSLTGFDIQLKIPVPNK